MWLSCVQLRASVLPGEDTAAMKRQRAALAARAAVEENMMQRVQLSKEERKRLKGARRSALSGGAMLEDFADDVAGIVQVHSRLKQPYEDLLSWAPCCASVVSPMNPFDMFCRGVMEVMVSSDVPWSALLTFGLAGGFAG